MKPEIYEKLGSFYLGRQVTPTGDAGGPLLYDSRDLTTHAVCVGMTGSGKTGLCIGLLEEAAIDGIPALVIDPKGDLANLLLTFPELRPEDFRPWIREDDARRQGVDPDAYAARQAERWRSGLAEWGQPAERIARLKSSADFAIYTPGSESGRPLSILSAFAAPPAEVAADRDALADRVATASTSLLGLLGLDADPVQSRDHILLSTLFQDAWTAGRDLDLAALISAIQEPPVDRVGVMPLEAFYPARERFGLAMRINNLLASPGFAGWLRGVPLDIDRLLYTDDGRPRLAILSIAHLSDAERMFFVTLLLSQTLSWMRTRPGTASLRALVYMDEVFGYLPPVAEPPSKRPLLTLLKQARAFGVGVALATQNPVDLDYKALSNIGTWFLGRLQTDRDRQRVLDGLAGSAASQPELARLLSGLEKRTFLLHNVHEDGPTLFRTRWVMSYLAGPLTRQQLRSLSAEPRPAIENETRPRSHPPAAVLAAVAANVAAGTPRPVLPPGIEERFLRAGSAGPYRPHLVAAAEVHFVDRRRGLEDQEAILLLTALGEDGGVHWPEAVEIEADDLAQQPAADSAPFAPLPPAAADPKAYRDWGRRLADHLYHHRRRELLKSPTLGLVSAPGESEKAFRIRLAESAREARDEAVDALRKRYASKLGTVERRLRRARERVDRERQQASTRTFETAISVGTSLLGAFLGRRRSSVATAGRGVGRVVRERGDVRRAEEALQEEEARLEELSAELEAEIDALDARFDPATEPLETLGLKPRRTDVNVLSVALCWVLEGDAAD